MDTDKEPTPNGLSRRRLLQAGGAIAGAAAVAAGAGAAQVARAARAKAATGTIADLQHVVMLPDTVALINQSDSEKSFPAVKTPAEGAQVAPVQEAGTRVHRPTSLMPYADVAINRSSFTVTATMSNSGAVGVSLFVFPDKYLTASATPFTVVNAANKTYTWSAAPRPSCTPSRSTTTRAPPRR